MKRLLHQTLRILLVTLVLFSAPHAWAGDSHYYAKLQAKVATNCSGMGKVYAATSNSTPAASAYGTDISSGTQDATNNAGGAKTFYAFAKAEEGYSFTGWYSADNGGGEKLGTETSITVTVNASSSSGQTNTKTIYASFVQNQALSILFMPATNGSYTVNGTKVTQSGGQSITCEGAASLVATPASGYKFYGWYTSADGGTTRSYFSYAASTSYTFTSAVTVYAEFVTTSTAVFIRNRDESVHYKGLAEALSGFSSGLICLCDNGTVPAGNYTIPSGVTLLIPFDAAYTTYTTMKDDGSQVNAKPTGQKAYKKLTLANGANLTIAGVLNVGGRQNANMPNGGCPYGAYGQIDMQSGSTITLNNGANLYCWGYITGSGKVTARSGSTVHEGFQLTDFRGGNASSSFRTASSCHYVFPMQQYYIQNIETTFELQYGAVEKVYSGISTSFGITETGAVTLIDKKGNSGLFLMDSGAAITRKYNGATDRQEYTIDGNVTLSSITIYVYISITSSSYVLPVTNNMSIVINSGTTTITNDISLIADARITIKPGAKAVISSGKSLYVYDKDQWKGKRSDGTTDCGYIGSDNAYLHLIPYAPSKNYTRSYTNMSDAQLDVQGTLECNGKLFTTSSGANVCCSEGNGSIIFKAAAPANTNTYQAVQKSNTIEKWAEIPVTSAQLHNGAKWYSAPYVGAGKACEYLATTGTPAGTTVRYADDHWGWMEIWKDENGDVLAASNTCAKVNNAAAQDALLPTPPDGYDAAWETEEVAANQEVVHTATFTRNTFTVTWKDGSSVLKTETLTKNTKPSYDYQKPATERWVYTMTGWSDGTTSYAADALPLVTKDVTYTAQYDAAPHTYTIRFLNDDNSVLQTSSMTYAATPVYEGEQPYSTIEDGYIRAFAGWSPQIVDNSVAEDADYTANYDIVASLLVDDEQTITVNGSVTTTTVQIQGSLTISNDKTLRTKVLILEASMDKSGEVSGNVDAEKAYYDFSFGGSAPGIWYDIAVPWEVDATTGIYIDGEQKQLNKDFYLIYYNGALRASQNRHTDACWQFVNMESAPDKFLHPGRLYMIYLPTSGVDKLRFERYGSGLLTTSALQVYQYSADDVVNAGWNGIANPATFKAFVNAGANTVTPTDYAQRVPNFGQKYIPADDNYRVFNMSTTPLETAQPVFVQAAADRTVVLNATQFPALQAPQRAIVKDAYYEVLIGAADTNDFSDRLYLQTMEQKEDTYVIGLDLAKAGVSSKVAQMWVNRYNTRLCVNTTAPVGRSTSYPLGIYAPKAGEYQIYTASEMEENQELYVTRDGKPIWNLAYGPYTIALDAGTYTEYGLKLIQSTPAVTTGVDPVTDDQLPMTNKVLIDNQVYILREGELYTITGQKVQ